MKRAIKILLYLGLFPFFVISQTITGLNELAPFNEELAAVRKGEQWGFLDRDGKLVIPFRNDLFWNREADRTKMGVQSIAYPSFKDGRSIIVEIKEGIAHYGFIDTTGKVVIEPMFLNVREFENGYTTGIIYEKVFKGENEFKLNIYDIKFHEVLMDKSGKIIEYLAKPDNIQLKSTRYKIPWLRTKMVSKDLISIRTDNNLLEIRKLEL